MSEEWHRSTRSGSVGNCVEVARRAGVTLIRDSKQPHGARLCVSRERWRGFLLLVGSDQWRRQRDASAR
ncbi:DUF397 domain-containing protein [Saccharopolyspora sp. NFXS83]|uniref:DUF397 domain-containing protein n=1 Tax=Saccharopolyspora sp. NFXS83 TaxID=2993560 RepID=UPI00224A702B|nr:DUF397 domain-containing protein [Saccharopolyspora sp. NFXS83]MCX2733084.1 DUF397 domain-containing protein [Saccharopolyspora sp. NFXS83]